MADEVLQDEMDAEELEQDQYLVFTTQTQEFGLQAICVKEITSVLGTTKVPNAPAYIEGIVNLRGRLASVVNFRKKFGFEPKEHDEDTRIIIVEQEGFPIGILVDSVEEVIKVPESVVQKLPESTSNSVSEDYITGVGVLEERLIILLELNKILAKTELVEIEEMRQAMEDVQAVITPEKAAEVGQTIDEVQAVKAPEKTESDQIDDEQLPEASPNRTKAIKTKEEED